MKKQAKVSIKINVHDGDKKACDIKCPFKVWNPGIGDQCRLFPYKRKVRYKGFYLRYPVLKETGFFYYRCKQCLKTFK